MSNLPHTPMYWLDIPEHFNDLVIGTYGRCVWILDDISPLQQLTATNSQQQAFLFSPKDAYRFQPITMTLQFFPAASTGEDPPFGASINFWLPKELADSVGIHFTNQSGDTLRTIKHKGKAGINRVWWDFKRDKIDSVKMRTKPRYADWYSLEDDRTRSLIPMVANFTHLVAPWTYGVHLEAGDQRSSETIQVLKDPHSEGTMADIQAQTQMLENVYDDLNTGAAMLNQIESIRRQLYDLRDILDAYDRNKEVIKAIGSLDSTLIEFENRLVQLNITGTGQDLIRWPSQLMEKLAYLGSAVASADFAPADQHKEVHQMLKSRLTAYQKEMNQIMAGPFAEFLQLLEEKDIGVIVH